MKIEVGSALSAQIKQGQGAGAGVGADDGAHIVDADVLGAEALPDHLGHGLRVLQAVAVADEDGLFPRPR